MRIWGVLLAWAVCFVARAEAVRASDFGFDAANATACLQCAIDSGASTVIVDNVGEEWLLAPIHLRSGLELVFADGVKVRALPGAFKERVECMFSAKDAKNITIRGEGSAEISMNKADYRNPELYRPSEWRHLISLCGCENVFIGNLTLRESGGDGIYLGAGSGGAPCRNVLVENVVCDGNHRQGMSVICAENLTVKESVFCNTEGTLPSCGLDIEPNSPDEVIRNVLLDNCEFYGNANCGLLLYFQPFKNASSVTVRNCRSYRNANCGLSVYSMPEMRSAGGVVKFENCRFYENYSNAMIINNQYPGGQKITFRNCLFDNRSSDDHAVLIFNNSQIRSDAVGVHFEETTFISDEADEKLIRFMGEPEFGITDVSGAIVVVGVTPPRRLDWRKFRKTTSPAP